MFLPPVLQTVLEEIASLESQADAVRTQLAHLATQMPDVQHLLTVPGVGILTATALVAFVGDIHRFRSGRHFAAWLGLTPREHSSGAVRRRAAPCGAVRRLGRITKHGNTYLWMLLIHAARSACWAGTVTKQLDDLRTWARARRPSHPQRGRRRPRQQTRPRLLAGVARPATLRTARRALANGATRARGKPTHRRAAPGSRRWRPVRPAGGRADNSHGPWARVQAIGTLRATFHRGRGLTWADPPGRRYDCSRPRAVTGSAGDPQAAQL